MGLRERLAQRWARPAIDDVIERGLVLLEAQRMSSERQLAEAISAMHDPDDYLYRRTGEESTRWTRSMDALRHEEIVEACFDMAKRNPLGRRLTELTRDMVVGDGITYSCRNPNVEDIVGEFWHDPDNNLDVRNADFANELGMYGELIPEAWAGNVSGIVKLGYIDVAQVKRVTVAETVEEIDGKNVTRRNPLIQDIVWIREKGFSQKGRPLEIIRNRGGKLEGDVFFFKVNSPSNDPRGWPDLMHVADWLQALDAMLWEISERARLMRTFIWDVTLKDADPVTLANWLRQHGSAPRSGTVRAHDANESWQAVSPQLGAYEAAKERDVVLEHLAGGFGVPKTWLSAAEDVNRATAQEMGGPALRKFGHRQNQYVDVLKKMIAYVLEKAIEHSRIKGADQQGRLQAFDDSGKPALRDGKPVLLRPHELVQIHAPEVSPKDLGAAGALLGQVTSALSLAEDENWIGHDPARQVLALVLQQLGYDYDPNSEDLEAPEDAEVDPKAKTKQLDRSRKELEQAVEALVG